MGFQRSGSLDAKETRGASMIVALQGGLANQIYQYAFGISLAKAKRAPVFFTRDRVDRDPKRSYGLDAFHVEPTFVSMSEEKKPYYYDGGPFNFSAFEATQDTTFIGYWQSEEYLNYALVRSQLGSFARIPSAKTFEVRDRIHQAGAGSVFMHIRRGDYASEKHTNAFHGVLPEDYYHEAYLYMWNKMGGGNFHVFVFSDDPDWCRQKFGGLTDNYTIVDHNKAGDGKNAGHEWEDLWLMRSCRHAILANSAFSLW